MNKYIKSIVLFFVATILLAIVSCSDDNSKGDTSDPTNPTPTPTSGPAFSGNLNTLFVGHSTMNDIVDNHVKTMAESADETTTLSVTDGIILNGGGLSLESKMNVGTVGDFFNGEASLYDFVVVTEQWDYQFYNPTDNSADTNNPVTDCPSSYTAPTDWVTPPDDWFPTPYALQQYADATVCGNPDGVLFYYQTWSLGYNEVENGATRASDQNYVRPTVEEIRQLQAGGQGRPDLPLADRIEFEGVKWESFVKAANRPNIVFIPAGYAAARLMREIEAGVVPGFEAVSSTGGMTEDGELAWVDYLFYEDQYHASSIGNYFMSLMIYASVFNQSPEGLEIGTGLYSNSEFYPDNQYPLQGITNAEYQTLLTQTGSSGIYDLRGHNNLDYVHDDLRAYLQRLAWEVVQEDSSY